MLRSIPRPIADETVYRVSRHAEAVSYLLLGYPSIAVLFTNFDHVLGGQLRPPIPFAPSLMLPAPAFSSPIPGIIPRRSKKEVFEPDARGIITAVQNAFRCLLSGTNKPRHAMGEKNFSTAHPFPNNSIPVLLASRCPLPTVSRLIDLAPKALLKSSVFSTHASHCIIHGGYDTV